MGFDNNILWPLLILLLEYLEVVIDNVQWGSDDKFSWELDGSLSWDPANKFPWGLVAMAVLVLLQLFSSDQVCEILLLGVNGTTNLAIAVSCVNL